MIEEHHRDDARKWIARQVRDGATRDDLHRLVDGALDGMLREALQGQRAEQHRADVAEVEAQRVTEELAQLRSGVAALGVRSDTETGEA
jgi:hypothetical protein